MIPPKIKKLPKLRQPISGYIKKPEQGSMHSNRTLYMGGTKMIR